MHDRRRDQLRRRATRRPRTAARTCPGRSPTRYVAGRRRRRTRTCRRPRSWSSRPVLPAESQQLDGHARAARAPPARPRPALPPPGLKSRQTTPLIPPWSGSGLTACSAPAGTSLGRDRRSGPMRRRAAGRERLSSASRPPSRRPRQRPSTGAAAESTPGGGERSLAPTRIAGVDGAAVGVLLVHDRAR